MPYRIPVPGLTIEVIADSSAEVIELLNAFHMPRTKAPSTPAPKRATPKRTNGSMSAHGQKRVDKWLEVFRLLESTPGGIPAQEVANRLGVARMNGLGRALVPIRTMLAEHGFPSWDDAIVKSRTDDGVIWRAGPKIDQAIKIVEGESKPG